MISRTQSRTCFSIRGFTLIELLVTIAIAAVLAKLAAPSIQDFIIKSRMAGIGSQFTNGILRARTEALNRNTCTVMCRSTTPDLAITTDSSGKVTAGPRCANSGQDWQSGWIVFIKEDCVNGSQVANSMPARQEDYISVQSAIGNSFNLQSQGPTNKLFFQAAGWQGSGADRFDLQHQDNKYTERFGFNICVDVLGRTRTISWSASC